ncbi:hypothetical protein [Polyangium spumosum]|uniref:Uncharacterized protein n=1 Tax=Polyangium spumosum TaxID=889282 RepID=A0A6N7PNM9_9BACT|nr:hypothetical protein [Polyangium spumosum]MRG92416.1 hypothetical protein [Polyangium spumosum]
MDVDGANEPPYFWRMFGAGSARSGVRQATRIALGALVIAGCSDTVQVKPGGSGAPPPEEPRLSGTLLY